MEKQRLFKVFAPVITFDTEHALKRLEQNSHALSFHDADGSPISLDMLSLENRECLFFLGNAFYMMLEQFDLLEDFEPYLEKDRTAFTDAIADCRKRFQEFAIAQEKKEKKPLLEYPVLNRETSDQLFCRLVAADIQNIYTLYAPFNVELVKETLIIALTATLLEIDGILDALNRNDAASVLDKTLDIFVAFHVLLSGHKDVFHELNKWNVQKKAASIRHKDNKDKRSLFRQMLDDHIRAHGTKDIIEKFDRPAAEKLGIEPETASKWRQQINRLRKMTKN